MNAILAAGTGLSNFACSAEECLSWIIILLNILTVFYLVFCAWFKVTKTVKIVGYVWASALAVGTIAVVASHTCIFTILSAVFTALILMAVLSVVFNKGVFANEKAEEKTKKTIGAYVIHKTDDGKYVFLLYNDKRIAIGRSNCKYDSIDEVKKAIALCRENGLFVSVENKTKSWIEFVNHPKFIMYEEGGKFRFYMTLSDESIMLKSDVFEINAECETRMEEAVSAVKTQNLFYSEQEVLSGCLFMYPTAEKKGVVTEEVRSPQAVAAEEQRKKAIVEEVAAGDEDEEEEEIIVVDKEGHTFRILRNKSFTAKLMQSSDEVKKYYSELKNEILSYKPTRSRVSWFFDSVNSGRTPLVKFCIRGKSLCVYYALNPDDYADSKYKVERAETAKYTTVPCMYRIINGRRLKYAKQLIATVCEKAGLQQGIVPTEDYSLPHESTEALIKKGMIKEITIKKQSKDKSI